NINVGQVITYTVVYTQSVPNTEGAVVISLTLPAGVDATTSTVTGPADGVGGVNWDEAGAGTATLPTTSTAVTTAAITGTAGTMPVTAVVTGDITAGPTVTVDDAGG